MPDVDFLTLASNVHSLHNTIQDATNPIQERQTKREENTNRSPSVLFWIAGGCTIVGGISTAVCFIIAKKNLAIGSAIATAFSGLTAIREYANRHNKEIDELNQDFAQDIYTLKTVHTTIQDQLLSCESLVDSLKTMHEEALGKWQKEHDKFTTTVTNVKELETSFKTTVHGMIAQSQRTEETLETLEGNVEKFEQVGIQFEGSVDKLREQVDSLKEMQQAFEDSSVEASDKWVERMERLVNSLKTILKCTQEQAELLENFSVKIDHAVSIIETSTENIGVHTAQIAEDTENLEDLATSFERMLSECEFSFGELPKEAGAQQKIKEAQQELTEAKREIAAIEEQNLHDIAAAEEEEKALERQLQRKKDEYRRVRGKVSPLLHGKLLQQESPSPSDSPSPRPSQEMRGDVEHFKKVQLQKRRIQKDHENAILNTMARKKKLAEEKARTYQSAWDKVLSRIPELREKVRSLPTIKEKEEQCKPAMQRNVAAIVQQVIKRRTLASNILFGEKREEPSDDEDSFSPQDPLGLTQNPFEPPSSHRKPPPLRSRSAPLGNRPSPHVHFPSRDASPGDSNGTVRDLI